MKQIAEIIQAGKARVEKKIELELRVYVYMRYSKLTIPFLSLYHTVQPREEQLQIPLNMLRIRVEDPMISYLQNAL